MTESDRHEASVENTGSNDPSESTHARDVDPARTRDVDAGETFTPASVSYTHLTLPTM